MLVIREIPSSYKKKNVKKQEPFIIINNDNVGGVYVQNIINTLINTGLVQQDLRFGGKRVEKIKLYDAIVVGDCDSNFNYDFRVVKHKRQKSLESLDGRSFKVYDLIRDYEKVLAKIKAYAKANSIGEYKYKKQTRRSLGRKSKSVEPVQVNLVVNFEEEPQPVFMAKDVSSFKRVEPIRTTEKATFFSDWVKIGMNQFDIEYDVLGNEYISDSALNKYYISEDRRGRRFLVTR